MGKKPRKKVDANAWLNTYADMVTLLLCFFVLLFSMSSLSMAQFDKLAEALNPTDKVLLGLVGENEDPLTIDSSNPEAEADINLTELGKEIMAIIEEANLDGSVDVEAGEGYVFLTFRDNIFFAPNRANILPDGRRALDAFIKSIRGREKNISILSVHGHTTQLNEERIDKQFDRELSSNRAVNVLTYIENRTRMNGKFCESIGHGMYYPVADFKTEPGREKNRRVEIYIASDKLGHLTLSQVYDMIGIETHDSGE